MDDRRKAKELLSNVQKSFGINPTLREQDEESLESMPGPRIPRDRKRAKPKPKQFGW